MKKELRSQLKGLRKAPISTPDADWTKQRKTHLMAKLGLEETNKAFSAKTFFSIFMPLRSMVALRGVFVVLLIVGVVSSTLGVAASPIPRDIVYNVKYAAATVTGNNETKGKLAIQNAQHQLADISKIDAQKDPKKVEKKLKTIKKRLESANEELKEVKEKKPEKTTALAKEVTEKTTELNEGLKTVVEAISGDEIDPTVVESAIEAKKEVNEAGIDALQLLADAIGDIEQPSEETKEIVEILEKKIDTIVRDVESVNSEAKLSIGMNAVVSSSTAATSTLPTSTALTDSTSSVPVTVTETDPLASPLVEAEQTTTESAPTSSESVSSVKDVSTTVPAEQITDSEKEQSATLNETVKKTDEGLEAVKKALLEPVKTKELTTDIVQQLKALQELGQETEEVLIKKTK